MQERVKIDILSRRGSMSVNDGGNQEWFVVI